MGLGSHWRRRPASWARVCFASGFQDRGWGKDGSVGERASPASLGWSRLPPVRISVGVMGDGQGMMRQTSALSRATLTTTGLFLAWLNLDGRSRAQAGGFAPGITVGARVDERSSSVVSGGQWVGSVAPQLAFGRLGPLASWEISALRSYESYSSSPAPKPATDVASIWASSAPTQHSKLSLDGAYLRSQDLFYLAPGTPLPSGQTELASGSIQGLSSFAEATYQIQATNHEAAEKADGLYQAWTAAILPMNTAHSRLFVQWSQKDWWLDHGHALRVGAATAGYRRDHSPVLTSEFGIGLADSRDVQHGTQRRDLAVSAGVSGLGRAMGLPFDARALVARDVSTTGTALLWRSVANTWLGARWERTLGAHGGLFDEPTLRDLVGIEVRDTLGGRTVATLKGSYARTRPRVGDGLRVEDRNASASLSRQLQPWLSARAAYLYSRQTEIRGAAPQDSERSRAELTLTAALP